MSSASAPLIQKSSSWFTAPVGALSRITTKWKLTGLLGGGVSLPKGVSVAFRWTSHASAPPGSADPTPSPSMQVSYMSAGLDDPHGVVSENDAGGTLSPATSAGGCTVSAAVSDLYGQPFGPVRSI